MRPGAGARGEWLAIAAAFVIIAVVASVWLAIDRRPPEWDHANHLERAVQCARELVVEHVFHERALATAADAGYRSERAEWNCDVDIF